MAKITTLVEMETPGETPGKTPVDDRNQEIKDGEKPKEEEASPSVV